VPLCVAIPFSDRASLRNARELISISGEMSWLPGTYGMTNS
jgi:hypothetical protein